MLEILGIFWPQEWSKWWRARFVLCEAQNVQGTAVLTEENWSELEQGYFKAYQ